MTTIKHQPHYKPSNFPSFEFGHVLPPKITSAKIRNPELRGCLSAAIYMVSQIDLTQGSIHLRVEPIQSAYFRATLAELVRVEDIAKVLGSNFKLNKTDDPLLHTVKLLRNYQVHIGTVNLSTGSIAVLWGNQETVYQSFIADNLSAQELRKLDSAKSYSDEQLEELVNLFDIHQRKFGVVQLLYNTCLHIGDLLEKA